jgi:sugar phosphate isomerase/epimerase
MVLPSRRDLGRALALAAGAAAFGGAASNAFAGRRLHRIGLITGTIGKALQADFVGTMKKVAAVGYKELEFGHHKGMPDKDFKKLLDDLGIAAVAGGSARKQLEDGIDAFVEQSHLFGKKYVVCYWPWLDSGKNKTIDDWKRLCDDMNRLGARVKAGGLRFAYHNHDIEFAVTDGQIPYDVVLRGTDPDLVDMELDLYWITKGGQDAVAYLKQHPGRFALFHVKDMDAAAEHGKACPGQGTINFRPMLAEGVRAGVRHFIVENEGVADPMPCIERSYAFLSQLRY